MTGLDAFVDSMADQLAAKVIARIEAQGIVQPRLLTVEQAARYLGRTEEAVRRLRLSGKLPVVKLDDRVMFDVRDLDGQIVAHKE